MNDPSLDFSIQIQPQNNENQHLSSNDNYNPEQFRDEETQDSSLQEEKVQTKEERDREIESLREKYNNYSTGANLFLDSSEPVFKAENPVSQYLNGTIFDINQSAHPRACIASVLFKILAIVSYFLIGGFFKKLLFVTLFTTADFWIMKSICGRVLVGLQWWLDFSNYKNSKVDKIANFATNKIDYNFFWYSLWGFTAIWGLFAFVNFITFGWFTCLMNILQFLISGGNCYQFYICSKVKSVDDVQADAKGLFQSVMSKVMFNNRFFNKQ